MATESQTLGTISPPRVFIDRLSEHVGQEVTIKGWIYNLRSGGKILFPQLRDGTGVVQCVALKSSVAPEVWDALKALGQESALSIRGTVRKTAARQVDTRLISCTRKFSMKFTTIRSHPKSMALSF